MKMELRASPPRLYTGNRVLDGFLGGLAPGRLAFLNSASPFVHDLAFTLAVRHVLDFDRDAVFVDGGNTLNPHALVALAKRFGSTREEVLGRVRVARAFTVYQMTSLLLESLEEEVRAGPGLLVLSRLPDLFLDEEVEYQEAYHLLRRGLLKVQELVREEELIGVMTNLGLSQLFRRRGIGNLLHQMADRIVRIRYVKGGLQLALPEERRTLRFLPVRADQAVLEDYGEMDLATLVVPKVLRSPLAGPASRTRQVLLPAFS
ncbi:MAG: hypothetical protein R3291_00015 [Thermoplasmata archaeon]|nr:hypothetical protein [Thermoplasmata archaeon]